MVRIYIAILVFAFCEMGYSADESQQPPLLYTLTIDDKSQIIQLDTPTKIDCSLVNPTVVLSASPVRHFSYGCIEFDYPANYTWEAEIMDDMDKQWTLSGTDATIIISLNPEQVGTKDVAQALFEGFSKNSPTITLCERVIGDTTYKGQCVTVRFSETTLVTEVYAFPSEYGSRIFMLQDILTDDGKHSADAESFFKLLGNTLKVHSVSSLLAQPEK